MTQPRVITQQAADRINGIAQDISPTLFWTCNYEPTPRYAISDDAEFLLGIQDLYKYTIDTNCILKTIAYNPRNSICDNILSRKEREELRRNLDVIQNLRTVVDHNQSEQNGRVAVENRTAFTNWVRVQLGKDEPTCLDDYHTLSVSLVNLGNSILLLSEEILQRIKNRNNRQTIVDKWTQTILNWYCTGARQDYYMGQLLDYYITLAVSHKAQFLDNTDPVYRRTKVNHWIGHQITFSQLSSIERLEEERQSIQESLVNPSSIELAIKDAQPEKYKQVIRFRNSRLSEIETEIGNLRTEVDQIEAECGNNPVGYFFSSSKMKRQLQDTLDYLRTSGISFTLLPQSLIQEDVVRNFKGVPSPDGDF